MTSKRRRQTRNRRTTGFPPELHNEMVADPMTPNHDPSPRCESGGYPHCTCDTCY